MTFSSTKGNPKMSCLEEIDLNQEFVFTGPVTQEELIITWKKRRLERLKREKAEAESRNSAALEVPSCSETSEEIDESAGDNVRTLDCTVAEPHDVHHPQDDEEPEAVVVPSEEEGKSSGINERTLDCAAAEPDDVPQPPVDEEPEALGVPSEEEEISAEISERALDCTAAEHHDFPQPQDDEGPEALRVPSEEEGKSSRISERALDCTAAEPDDVPQPLVDEEPEALVVPSEEEGKSSGESERIAEPSPIRSLTKEVEEPVSSKPTRSILRPARLNVDAATFTTDWTKRINMKKLGKPKRPEYVQPLE